MLEPKTDTTSTAPGTFAESAFKWVAMSLIKAWTPGNCPSDSNIGGSYVESRLSQSTPTATVTSASREGATGLGTEAGPEARD